MLRTRDIKLTEKTINRCQHRVDRDFRIIWKRFKIDHHKNALISNYKHT